MIEWYNHLKERNGKMKANQIIITALKIGKLSMEQTNVEANYKSYLKNSINKIDDKIKNLEEKTNIQMKCMDNLNNLTMNLTAITKTPSVKGKIAENILKEMIDKQLKVIYPTCKVSNVSQKPHESDIQIEIDTNKILLESKYYESVVRTTQIDKFLCDLEHTGAKAGIMVSFTSGIVGKRKMFEYEFRDIGTTKNVMIVYLSNCGDTNLVLTAVILVKMVIENSNKFSVATDYDLKNIFLGISTHLDDLIRSSENMSNIRYNIQQGRKVIENIMNKLYREVFECELKLKNNIEMITKLFTDNLQKIESENKLISEYDKDINDLKIEKYIKKLRMEKNKKYFGYHFLYEIINEISDEEIKLIINEENEMLVSVKDKKIAKTYSTKKRVDIKFDIKCLIGNEIKVKYGSEVINGSKIIVTIKECNKILIKERIESYLN